MVPRERARPELNRIPERNISLRCIRFVAQVDVDRKALEERWGTPEFVSGDLGEWVCFAFSSAEGESILLQREVEHPPAPGFLLSVTSGLFSTQAVSRIIEALGIPDAQVIQVNEEAVS
ncbi:hypothetical protein ACIQWV_39475 [Streptomyces sp. NPDC098085]|uniref:hypothetical protein n=1 Tax=Streptomyces sp. NPDC098085 TaxID=3366094 RepID=UPI0038080EDB